MKSIGTQRYKVMELRMQNQEIEGKERIKRSAILYEMVYTDYISLIKNVYANSPDMAGYLSASYYYDTLAGMYGVTPKYVARIVNNTIKNTKNKKK